jgi:hypothetical protein
MRLKITALSALTLGTFAFPALAAAATLFDTLKTASVFFNAIIGLFITLAIVVFFWGLIKYLWSMDNENAHEGLKQMFWGLIAIFVMVSIWGLIKLIQGTLGVQNATTITAPKGIQYTGPGSI